jgi:hypothetical protein
MPRDHNEGICVSCKQHARISWHQIRVNGEIAPRCRSTTLCATCGETQRDQVPAAACSGRMWTDVRKELGDTGQYPTDDNGRYNIPAAHIIENVDERIANPVNQNRRRTGPKTAAVLQCVACGEEGKQSEMDEYGLALFGHLPTDCDRAKKQSRYVPWKERGVPWVKPDESDGRAARKVITWPTNDKEEPLGGPVCKRCFGRTVTMPEGKQLCTSARGAHAIEAARAEYRLLTGKEDAPPTVYHCMGENGEWVLPNDPNYLHGPVYLPGNWKPQGDWSRLCILRKENPWFKYTCAGLGMHPSDPDGRKPAAATSMVSTTTTATAAEEDNVQPTGPATAEQVAAILRNQVDQKKRDEEAAREREVAAHERKLILDQQKQILGMLRGIHTPETPTRDANERDADECNADDSNADDHGIEDNGLNTESETQEIPSSDTSTAMTCIEIHGLTGIPEAILKKCTDRCARRQPPVRKLDEGKKKSRESGRASETWYLAGLCTLKGGMAHPTDTVSELPQTTKRANPWSGGSTGTCRTCRRALKNLEGFEAAQKKAHDKTLLLAVDGSLRTLTYNQLRPILQEAYNTTSLRLKPPAVLPHSPRTTRAIVHGHNTNTQERRGTEDRRPTKRARRDADETLESLSEKVRVLTDQLRRFETLATMANVKAESTNELDLHDGIVTLGAMGLTPTTLPGTGARGGV